MDTRRKIELFFGTTFFLIFLYLTHFYNDVNWMEGVRYDVGIPLYFTKLGLFFASLVFFFKKEFKLYLSTVFPEYFPHPETPDPITDYIVNSQPPFERYWIFEFIFFFAITGIFMFTKYGIISITASLAPHYLPLFNICLSISRDLMCICEMLILTFVAYILCSLLQRLAVSLNKQ